MFLTPGLIIQALILAGAVWLVVHMYGRLPSDLDELRAKYRAYRSRNDPDVLGKMESEERRRNHQQRCAIEFRSTVFVDALLWGFTLLAGLYAFWAIVTIISNIASSLRNM